MPATHMARLESASPSIWTAPTTKPKLYPLLSDAGRLAKRHPAQQASRDQHARNIAANMGLNTDPSSIVKRQRDKDALMEDARRNAAEQMVKMDKSIYKKMGKPSSTKTARVSNITRPEPNRYQFEPDSEDEKLEKEIETNMDALQDASSRLHTVARTISDE